MSRAEATRAMAHLHRDAVAAEIAQQTRRLALVAQERQKIAATKAARTPLTSADLIGATHVRTRHGWHQVAHVNRLSVRVVVERGMDDRVPLTRVLEVRT